jgi:hypothetical protein
MPPEPVSYTLPPAAPAGYVCGLCNAENGKLWRLYNVFLDNQELTCKSCTEALDTSGPDDFDLEPALSSGHLCGRICAVPTQDNTSFWGFTSIPEDGVVWWRALPDQAEQPAKPPGHE